MTSSVHLAAFDALGTRRLYSLLQLRSSVFVVEQRCSYQDLDGRDVEPGTQHAWIESGGSVVAALRVLDEGPERRIGRVCTHPAFRGKGLATQLLQHALGACAPPFVLAAQQHLQQYYERLGFSADGAAFEESGIVHIPMRRSA